MHITKEINDECMIVTCVGESNCENCIENIYRPILNILKIQIVPGW